MNFLLDETRTNYIINIINNAKKKLVHIGLSASVDGVYMEDNRPFINKSLRRTEEFYDKLFKMIKNYNGGFHPMVYSNEIDKWIENFLWFQDNFEKYDIPYENIYLLEVRNKEWTIEQCKKFSEFLEFLVEWVWNKCNKNTSEFTNFLFKKKGFNILSTWLTTIGRGLGCSIQNTIQLRLGDLSIVDCHRLSYNHAIAGTFRTDGNKIISLEAKNLELYLAIQTLDGKCLPGCEVCIIKDLCGYGCLGSQYEATGDQFSPIPSVCRLEHFKIKTFINAFNKIGVLPSILGLVQNNKIKSIKLVMEEL